MAKTRRVRRGSRRLRKMRGRGMMNTMKRFTPSGETLRKAAFAITPSEAKQQWMKNKMSQAANATGRAASKALNKGANIWSAAQRAYDRANPVQI